MKKIISMLLALAMIFCLAACSSSEAPAPADGGETPEAEDLPITGQTDTLYLSMGTSSIGGSSYVVGGGLSKLFNEHIPGLDVAVEVTGGPQTNLELMDQGDAEMGLITAWAAMQAWNGEGWATHEMRNHRSVAPLWCSYFYILTRADSPINTLADINGMNVAAGSPGSSSDLIATELIEFFGLTPKSYSPLTADAQKDGFRDGTLDCIFIVNGNPSPAITDLQTTNDLKFISFTEEEMAKIKAEKPYWGWGVISQDSYEDLTGDYDAIALYQLLYVDKDLPDTLVYEMTKEIFDYHDDLVNVDQGLKDSKIEKIDTATTPLHPGAYKYYQENGVAVPDAGMPID